MRKRFIFFSLSFLFSLFSFLFSLFSLLSLFYFFLSPLSCYFFFVFFVCFFFLLSFIFFSYLTSRGRRIKNRIKFRLDFVGDKKDWREEEHDDGWGKKEKRKR